MGEGARRSDPPRFRSRSGPLGSPSEYAAWIMLLFSTQHWPLVVMVFPQQLDAAAVDQFIARFDACYGRGDRFASLLDMSQLTVPPDALQRRAFTDWAASRAVEMKNKSVATAMVITNPLVRG